MSDSSLSTSRRILITGVTGYVGGRLVNHLLERRYAIRVMSRDLSRLKQRDWSNQVEKVEADVFNRESLQEALKEVDTAYYLIHSMSGGETDKFAERDIKAARNFAEVARQNGVNRIIYLGGLGESDSDLSEHLKSRQATGEALRKHGPSVTEFRAAVVVGSGSKSFEMIRYLTERVPVMICPSWVYSSIQPIGIGDVLQYLTAALEQPESRDEIIEIGGADVQTYASMMTEYARIRGLRRWLIPVPVLTPWLSSHWVHWITPIPASLARPLIEGVRNNVIVKDDKAEHLFPDINPVDYATAVEKALNHLREGRVETSWSDSLSSSQGTHEPVILETHEGLIIERRRIKVSASVQNVYEAISHIGGKHGWPVWNWAWRLRGMVDRLFGGVGFRRGRRDSNSIRPGDAIDFWRVEKVDPPQLLRLRAEMKLPGRAWLEFKIERDSKNASDSKLIQSAYFAPKGLSGLIYWYGLYPFHRIIFSSMIKAFKHKAEQNG